MSDLCRIVFADHVGIHLVRPSDVLLMAKNMYLRPLREHSTPGRIYIDDCQEDNTKRLVYPLVMTPMNQSS